MPSWLKAESLNGTPHNPHNVGKSGETDPLYVPKEYPKVVKVDGKNYVVLNPEEEQKVTEQ